MTCMVAILSTTAQSCAYQEHIFAAATSESISWLTQPVPLAPAKLQPGLNSTTLVQAALTMSVCRPGLRSYPVRQAHDFLTDNQYEVPEEP